MRPAISSVCTCALAAGAVASHDAAAHRTTHSATVPSSVPSAVSPAHPAAVPSAERVDEVACMWTRSVAQAEVSVQCKGWQRGHSDVGLQPRTVTEASAGSEAAYETSRERGQKAEGRVSASQGGAHGSREEEKKAQGREGSDGEKPDRLMHTDADTGTAGVSGPPQRLLWRRRGVDAGGDGCGPLHSTRGHSASIRR